MRSSLTEAAFHSVEVRAKRDKIVEELSSEQEPWATGKGYGDKLPSDWAECRKTCLKMLIHQRTSEYRRQSKDLARRLSVEYVPRKRGREPASKIVKLCYKKKIMSPASTDGPVTMPTPSFTAHRSISTGDAEVSTNAGLNDLKSHAVGISTGPNSSVIKAGSDMSRYLASPPRQRQRFSATTLIIENQTLPRSTTQWIAATALLSNKTIAADKTMLGRIVFDKFARLLDRNGFDFRKHKLCWKAPHQRLLEIEDDSQLKHAIGVQVGSGEDVPYVDFVILSRSAFTPRDGERGL